MKVQALIAGGVCGAGGAAAAWQGERAKSSNPWGTAVERARRARLAGSSAAGCSLLSPRTPSQPLLSPGSAPRTRFLPRLHRSDSSHATKQALSKEATLLPGFSPQAVGVGECDGANQAARCQTPRHGSRQRVFGELGWPQLLVLVSCCGPSQRGAWI